MAPPRLIAIPLGDNDVRTSTGDFYLDPTIVIAVIPIPDGVEIYFRDDRETCLELSADADVVASAINGALKEREERMTRLMAAVPEPKISTTTRELAPTERDRRWLEMEATNTAHGVPHPAQDEIEKPRPGADTHTWLESEEL